MPSPINGLGIPTPPVAQPSLASGPEVSAAGETSDFGNMLLKSLNQLNGMQQSAQTAVEKSFAGDDITQIEAMTSMKKADLAMRLMIQIRNKIMDAYTEIKQMQM
jgi:flagellar hook-basal body complex protein FliE